MRNLPLDDEAGTTCHLAVRLQCWSPRRSSTWQDCERESSQTLWRRASNEGAGRGGHASAADVLPGSSGPRLVVCGGRGEFRRAAESVRADPSVGAPTRRDALCPDESEADPYRRG